MSATTSNTIDIAALEQELTSAQELAKAAKAEHGKDSEQAKEAKKGVDRVRAKLSRARKGAARQAGTNGHGNTAQVQQQAQRASRSTGRKRTGTSRAKHGAGDFAEPIALGKAVKANAKPKVLDRTEKGNKLRATRKNRETGTHISIVDAKLDRRFSKAAKEQGFRWVTLEEESGIAAGHKTWEGACFYARIPATWSDHSKELAAA